MDSNLMAITARSRYMLYIIIGIILFFLVTSFFGFYVSVKPPRLISRMTPSNLGLTYEDVSFITEDGLTIKGWFVPRQVRAHVIARSATTKQYRDSRDRHGSPETGSGSPRDDTKTIVLLHGYPADKGNILPSMAWLAENYNLLLFDFRRLGTSEGGYSTAGAHETKDLEAAVKYLKSRNINKVGIWGFSMGGAVALMTAPLTPEIRVIVTDSSYARLDLLLPTLYRYPVLKYPLGSLTSLWAKLFLQIDAKEVAPAEKAKQLNIPVLIIHSKQDNVIPFEHAPLLKEALKNNRNAEFWFQEDLLHGVHGLEYQNRIREFFARSL